MDEPENRSYVPRRQRGAMMPELHRRGVELLVDLLDAADQVASMDQEELRSLLRETAKVLGDLLKRDIPEERRG